MFHRTPFFLPWLYPALTWRIPTIEKVLYLTFDDGPVPGPTEFALEVLKKFSIQATFFCIGDNIRKHPDVFNRMVIEGHGIGNHTFNHINGWKTSTHEYLQNVDLFNTETEPYLANFNRSSTSLFRPPYGRITRDQIKSLERYTIIMWDVLTFDYSSGITPEDCLKKSILATRPGSIIVFHDSIKAEKKMVYALPRFVENFLEKGFRFKVIPS